MAWRTRAVARWLRATGATSVELRLFALTPFEARGPGSGHFGGRRRRGPHPVRNHQSGPCHWAINQAVIGDF